MSHPKNEAIPCSIAECGKDAARGGLCWGHLKRRERGQLLAKPVRDYSKTAWSGLLRAVDDFADATHEVGTEDAKKAWKRAEWRLRDAIRRYNQRKPKRA